jgi:hypothetical protein
VKNQRIIQLQIENSKVVRILKLGTDWIGQFVIFSDLCMKGKCADCICEIIILCFNVPHVQLLLISRSHISQIVDKI